MKHTLFVFILFYCQPMMRGARAFSAIKPVTPPCKSNIRIELFFKNSAELKDRLQLLSERGYSNFNIVNKDSKDDLHDWVRCVQEHNPDHDVCVHYSLKNQKVKRGKPEQHLKRLNSFLSSQDANEVLLVSGSIKSEQWNALRALQGIHPDQQVAVAFNPFFPNHSDRMAERKTLREKIETGRVCQVYLQFGSDVQLAREGIKYIRELDSDMPICASIFLPTAKLIAQQKFRPWKGVFLSPAFLSGPKQASETIYSLINLYSSENVKLLVEAPGVRTEKDLDMLDFIIEKSQLRENSSPTDKTPSSGTDEMIPTHSKPAIVLFGSHDVRLQDNEALTAAARHRTILPVFLWNPNQSEWGVRGALQVVLKDALRGISHELESNFGLPLICIESNNEVQELCRLAKLHGIGAVYWNRGFTPECRKLESSYSVALRKLGVETTQCVSSLLYDVEKLDLKKGFNGGHWGTLMPFFKACEKQLGTPRKPLSFDETASLLRSAKTAKCIKEAPPKDSYNVDDLQMAVMPPKTKWDYAILKRFPMTDTDAIHRMDHFFETGFLRYEQTRSRADLDDATSQLSMHLRIGTLSPNCLYWKTADSDLPYSEKKTFARRLIWRDLAYFQLFCFPDMHDTSIRKHYDDTEWVRGDELDRRLAAWKRGQTGYPIVDAGMRHLYKEGWMTQSVRMVVASFLTEYLRVNWVHGAAWFHDTLVDADLAINSMMWQNAGRSGTDQWNFVLSPETASQDTSGEYTRRWVPELKQLPNKVLHRPWKASAAELAKYGVILGETYPHRVIDDLKSERQISVNNVLSMRRKNQSRNDQRGYDLIRLPSGLDTVVFTKKEYRIDDEGLVFSLEQRTQKKGARSGRGRGGRKRSRVA